MTDLAVFTSPHPAGEAKSNDLSGPSLVTPEGTVSVQWAPEAATSTLGLVAFFIEFLHTTGLWQTLVERCPVMRTSPNAPSNNTAIGSVLLSVLSGGNRYRHSEALRGDRITPDLLGMDRMLSTDAIRRFVEAAADDAGQSWISDLLQETLEPAMAQGPWIMDLDSTVVTVFGKQEGSAVGYNPSKPGRPSYSYHTFMMGQLRLPIDVEAMPGNQSHGSHGASALWHMLDHRLPPEARPWCIRGDISYGNESYLSGCEQRQIDYLFKLKKTKKIQVLCDDMSIPLTDWASAGHGWEGRQTTVRLSGWSQQRRVIVLRKALPPKQPATDQPQQQHTILTAEICPDDDGYEYAVLITSLKHGIETIAQFYRDRADCENNFADLKNDWSWGGFTTQHQDRNQFMARFTALVYTWWNIFVRQFSPEAHREGHVSRPVLLHGVARQTEHAGRKTLHITSLHAKANVIMRACTALSQRLKKIASQAATQLTGQSSKPPWHHIITTIFQAILKKKRGTPLGLLT